MHVGVSVLITDGDRVLLGIRKNAKAEGLWSTPGGKHEKNETIIGCAARETREETGLELCGIPEVIAWKEHFRFDMHYLMFYVHAPMWAGVVTAMEPDKCDEWFWKPISEMIVNWQETTEPSGILKILMARVNARETKR